PHTKLRKVVVRTPREALTLADFGVLKSKYPYIALIPQADFLEFLAGEARRLPAFRLVLGANAKELVESEGAVRGVRYQSHEGCHGARPPLPVPAAGRFSKLRSLAGLELVKNAPPMDVLWFRLPRQGDEPEGLAGSFHVGAGRLLIALDRGDYWQLGLVIP